MKNYYEILGVDMEASYLEIKKAYFRLVRKYPPDQFPDEFMEIREAYETLSNENTRREYDEQISLAEAIRVKFEYSRQAFAEEEYEEAIKTLEEINKQVPGISLIQNLLGQAYIMNGNSGKAIRIFEELVRNNPDNAAFVGNLAEAYLDRGWHRRANSAYKRALELDEDNLSFWTGLADTYETAGDLIKQREVLIEALKRAKEKDWDNVSLYIDLIQNDIDTDSEEIGVHVDEFMQLMEDREDIRDAVGWGLPVLAMHLISSGHMDTAKVMADRASELLPDNSGIQFIQNELKDFNETRIQFDNLENDEDIAEEIVGLIAVEIFPESALDIPFPASFFKYMLEFKVAEEYDDYMRSIRLLKIRYPKLYEVKKDYFRDVMNPVKRKRLINKYRKQSGRYEAMLKDGGEEPPEYRGNVELWEEDDVLVQQPYVREHPKVGRNDPCPCGSGKKYKKCCGRNV